jgi:hypothetical protein
MKSSGLRGQQGAVRKQEADSLSDEPRDDVPQILVRENFQGCSRLVSAVLRVLGKLFCHLLPLDKFGYLCAQRSKHRE